MNLKKMIMAIKAYVVSEIGADTTDTDTLEIVINSLTPDERNTLLLGDSLSNPNVHEAYMFVVKKCFNRHNDICSRRTVIQDDGTIRVSKRSAITELDISYKTLVNCNNNCFFRIEDINKSILPSLTLESIADVTAAIIAYDAEIGEE